MRGEQGIGKSAPFGGYLEKLIRYGLKKKWGIELPEKGKDLQDFIVVSPDTARLGGKIRYLNKKTNKELFVNIPPKTRRGQKLRLRGMGENGHAGGEAGDLYVTVHIRSLLKQKAKDLIAAIKSFIGTG